MSVTYQKHRREYTIIGISAVVDAMVGKETYEVFGETYPEVISVIEDKKYFHCMQSDSREKLSRVILKKIESGEYKIDGKFDKYNDLVGEYEKLINLDENKFSLDTIIKFFYFYKNILPTFCIGLDAIDFIDYLDKKLHREFISFATSIRTRSETVYKNGEMTFLPKYLNWLSGNVLTNYTSEQLQYLIFKELESYILLGTSLPTPSDLDGRMKNFYLRQFALSRYEYEIGEKAIEKVATLVIDNEVKDGVDIKELSGRQAYQGKVVGKVSIVLTRADMQKFKEGDIIVSEMTDPSFLPIMKTASAFVTDEGGTLCHAAIVARELKKPCITGTKIATKVFKDGDMVEVDANSGVVRKI